MLLYFDIRPSIKFLDNEQKGRLFEAILEYGECGTEPCFEDPIMGMAWSFVRPRIDRDAESYDNTVEQKRYAGYCSAARRKKIEPVSFEEWKILPEESRRQLLADYCKVSENNGG